MQSEAAGADTEAAAGDPGALAKVLHEGGCTKQQAQTALYWKTNSLILEEDAI